MVKRDISKVLTGGTPLQRIKLLAEHIARGRFDFQPPELRNAPAVLTEAEATALRESFKKPGEIRLYNQWRRYDDTIVLALTNLQGIMLEAKVNTSNLRGYILVWNAIENAELLANHILHEIKDPKERKRIAEKTAKWESPLFTEAVADKEGYLDLTIDFVRKYKEGDQVEETKAHSLWFVMNNVKNQATASAVKFISSKKAILDYMDETGFNVKLYRDMIRIITEEALAPAIGWYKYNSDYSGFVPGSPHKRLDQLKGLYSITPKEEDLVDEEVYRWFKDNFLRDE